MVAQGASRARRSYSRVPYFGVIIGLDLAGTTGVSEGCPGQIPHLDKWELNREGDSLLDVCARGSERLLERIVAPRFIGNTSYGRGEAANEGLVRVAIEQRIRVKGNGARSADSHEITLGLYTAMGSIARLRGVLVREVAVNTVRKHFIGVGNLPSEPAKRNVKRMCEALGWKPPNFDAADAAAVWHWASWQWNPDVTPITAGLFSRCLVER